MEVTERTHSLHLIPKSWKSFQPIPWKTRKRPFRDSKIIYRLKTQFFMKFENLWKIYRKFNGFLSKLIFLPQNSLFPLKNSVFSLKNSMCRSFLALLNSTKLVKKVWCSPSRQAFCQTIFLLTQVRETQ